MLALAAAPNPGANAVPKTELVLLVRVMSCKAVESFHYTVGFARTGNAAQLDIAV